MIRAGCITCALQPLAFIPGSCTIRGARERLCGGCQEAGVRQQRPRLAIVGPSDVVAECDGLHLHWQLCQWSQKEPTMPNVAVPKCFGMQMQPPQKGKTNVL